MKLKIVAVFLLLAGRSNGGRDVNSSDDREDQGGGETEENGEESDRVGSDEKLENVSIESDESSDSSDTSGPEVTSSDYSDEYRHKLSVKPQSLKVQPKDKSALKGEVKKYLAEVKHGDLADFLGSNAHLHEPEMYDDLSRRFVPQYPYFEVQKKNQNEENDKIVPEKAPPELVLKVAEKSVLLNSLERPKQKDRTMQKLLRSGEFWNSVWVEDGDPKMLRSHPPKRGPESSKKIKSNSLKLKLSANSRYYRLIKFLQNISPRLVYIVNKEHR